MATDDTTVKEAAPSTTDESEEKDDVEGNWCKGGLTPDPEVHAPKASDYGKPGPLETSKCG